MASDRNILVSINKSYVIHFCVMLNSLLKNNADKFFCVYIMNADLTDDDLLSVYKRFENLNVKFQIIKVDDSFFKDFPKAKRYPYTVYYRILAPLMLPKNLDKILYLDSDVIVHGDIDKLYDIPFDGNYFIACTQVFGFMQSVNTFRLGVPSDYVYMNTGVMMMNLSELRGAVNPTEIREYTIRNKLKLALFDEDILCRFFGNRVKVVSPLIFNLSDRRIKIENIISKNKIDEKWVEQNNVIIHFLGLNKPWKDRYKGILGKYYKEYDE